MKEGNSYGSIRRLVMIRHGETGAEWKGRFIGSSDVPLGAVGRKQADALCELVDSILPARILTSSKMRAMETARLSLTRHPSMQVEVRAELSEIDFGYWEERPFDEIQMEDPKNAGRFLENEHTFVFPGGESVEAFGARIAAFQRHLQTFDAETVVLYTHGGPIRFLLCGLLGIPTERHRIFHIQCGAAAIVTLNDGFATLKGLNIRTLEEIL